MWAELNEDIDGRNGGRLMSDSIFTDDELRLLEHSPSDDGDSLMFDDDEMACRYLVASSHRRRAERTKEAKNKTEIKIPLICCVNVMECGAILRCGMSLTLTYPPIWPRSKELAFESLDDSGFIG